MIYLGDKAYKVVHEHKEAWNPEAFRERFSDVLERYDYIVGDWGYSQLRLKGFFKENNPKVTKDTSINSLQDYLNEYCNFGCAYFVVERVSGMNPPADQEKEPDAVEQDDLGDKAEKPERQEYRYRHESAVRVDRSERAVRSDRNDRSDQNEQANQSERSERMDNRKPNPNRGEQAQRSSNTNASHNRNEQSQGNRNASQPRNGNANNRNDNRIDGGDNQHSRQANSNHADAPPRGENNRNRNRNRRHRGNKADKPASIAAAKETNSPKSDKAPTV